MGLATREVVFGSVWGARYGAANRRSRLAERMYSAKAAPARNPDQRRLVLSAMRRSGRWQREQRVATDRRVSHWWSAQRRIVRA
jgi:hypothetical protein